MPRRLLAVGAVVMAVVALAALSQVLPPGLAVSGTSAPDADTSPSSPKTPWGEPDLQGIWTDVYQTPLQRPARYADKEFFTDEERKRLDELRVEIPRADDRVAPRGSEQDVSGAYNSVFNSIKPTGRRTSLIVDPPDGRRPPLTPDAQKRRRAFEEYRLALLQATDACKNKLPACQGGKYGPPSPRRFEVPPLYVATGADGGGTINRADGPEDRSLSERCMGGNLPDFGGFRQIVQSPGVVSIFYDTGQGQGWQRVIPVTSDPHLPAHVRQWWGDSRGRWEGNTLVVDVTNFTSKTDFQGSRENLHMIERWTPLNDTTLEYTATFEDPGTWTKPWTVKQELTRQDVSANRIYKEPRCHEGNYGLVGLLSGSRAEEKAFAQGRGPDPATRCTAGCGTGAIPAGGSQDIDAVSSSLP
jgi:hypothetical protein